MKIHLSSFKAAIFDIDGTMIRNMAYHKKAWQEFLEKHDIHLSDEEFKQKLSGKKYGQIFESVFGHPLEPEQIARYTEEKEGLYRELYKPYITEVEGLTTFINNLRAYHLKLAIATTAPKKNRDFTLRALNLKGKFEIIIGDEHVGKGKPDPEIYLSTASELGVEPSECVVFEDSPSGVKSGKSAGMTVVGLLTSHDATELSKADYLVRDFTDIDFI